MFKILVVEDNKELLELYSIVLEDHNYEVYKASDGKEALDIIDRYYIDLMICDVMLPNMDGFELTRQLRAADYKLPILMITAKTQMSDKREGFLAGTDDYMTKPIDVNEMIWRIKALLRRSKIANDRIITIGSTQLNYDNLTVSYNGCDIVLPQKEFYILYKLSTSINRIFTRRQIFDEIWGLDYEGDEHTLDVHIARIRDKFKNNPDFEIVTIRGLGYKVVNKHEK